MADRYGLFQSLFSQETSLVVATPIGLAVLATAGGAAEHGDKAICFKDVPAGLIGFDVTQDVVAGVSARLIRSPRHGASDRSYACFAANPNPRYVLEKTLRPLSRTDQEAAILVEAFGEDGGRAISRGGGL